MSITRKAGILLHPTALPGPCGLGTLGTEVYAFIDYLSLMGASLWQVLPLTPTGFGDSPYAARSVFAGNELLISMEMLAGEGLVQPEELKRIPAFPRNRVDFEAVRSWKMPLLMKSADLFLSGGPDQGYLDFCESNRFWLEDYALFMTLTEYYNGSPCWYDCWDASHRNHDAKELSRFQASREQEVSRWKVLQYLFFTQWMGVKNYAHKKGIEIIADVPIFVSADSADAWACRDLFKTAPDGTFSAQSGVPPDAFSATGQLWGTPVYDWKHKRSELFSWWIKRIGHTLKSADRVRLDHFRGFESYWEIAAGEQTAISGKWVKVPGKQLFKEMRASIGNPSIIAEDLGVITPEVEHLRDSFQFPGMKILQFAFELTEDGSLNADNPYLPHAYQQRCVAYTGTHDNHTSAGWYASIDELLRDKVRRYLARPDEDIVWSLIRAVMSSTANDVIILFQDLFSLGDETRFNTPSTVGTHNWSWRAIPDLFENRHIPSRFNEMVQLYGRSPTAFVPPTQENGQ